MIGADIFATNRHAMEIDIAKSLNSENRVRSNWKHQAERKKNRALNKSEVINLECARMVGLNTNRLRDIIAPVLPQRCLEAK